MSFVFVVDTDKRPLNPVHPGYARRLLTRREPAVWRRYPFTIILKKPIPDAPVEPLRLKVDPGSKTTDVALVNEAQRQVVAAAEITHRSQEVCDVLYARYIARRSRRARHTRYRAVRYDNRCRAEEWLAPSLECRIQNILTWEQRLQRLCPIGAISLELVKFDIQLLQNIEINGLGYQQGELAGYEVREYLLEKWGHQCAYRHKTDCSLQVEHIVPWSHGGSNWVSNLTLACKECNQWQCGQRGLSLSILARVLYKAFPHAIVRSFSGWMATVMRKERLYLPITKEWGCAPKFYDQTATVSQTVSNDGNSGDDTGLCPVHS